MNIYITTETYSSDSYFSQKLFFSFEEAFRYTVKRFIEIGSDFGFRIEFRDDKFYRKRHIKPAILIVGVSVKME